MIFLFLYFLIYCSLLSLYFGHFREKACVFFSMILAGSHGAVARVTSLPIRESDDIPNSYMADIFSGINHHLFYIRQELLS